MESATLRYNALLRPLLTGVLQDQEGDPEYSHVAITIVYKQERQATVSAIVPQETVAPVSCCKQRRGRTVGSVPRNSPVHEEPPREARGVRDMLCWPR